MCAWSFSPISNPRTTLPLSQRQNATDTDKASTAEVADRKDARRRSRRVLRARRRYTFVALFASRPVDLRADHCFPAAHASLGYALVALYFMLRKPCAVLARIGLFLGIALGLMFGICPTVA